MQLEEAFVELARYIGQREDLGRSELVKTPERFLRAYMELLSGYEMEPAAILASQFPLEEATSQVRTTVRVEGIHFFSLCEHHLLPFFGTVAIEYKPRNRVAGLSKLARLVHCYARRLQVQERMVRQIAYALAEHLQPEWVRVESEALHLCMLARGVRAEGATTWATAVVGSDEVIRSNEYARSSSHSRERVSMGAFFLPHVPTYQCTDTPGAGIPGDRSDD